MVTLNSELFFPFPFLGTEGVLPEGGVVKRGTRKVFGGGVDVGNRCHAREHGGSCRYQHRIFLWIPIHSIAVLVVSTTVFLLRCTQASGDMQHVFNVPLTGLIL